MKNIQIIEKILSCIGHKEATLSKSITIEDETYRHITCVYNEWILYNSTWELPLNDMTNKELIKLYKSL